MEFFFPNHFAYVVASVWDVLAFHFPQANTYDQLSLNTTSSRKASLPQVGEILLFHIPMIPIQVLYHCGYHFLLMLWTVSSWKTETMPY